MKLKNFLLEIPSENWIDLRDMYAGNWPENYSTYFAIENAIKLKEQDHENFSKEVQMFSLNGDWSDGTFILLVSLRRFLFVYVIFLDSTILRCFMWNFYKDFSQIL